ncbi:epimerase family protein [Acrasis kona]|uniref:Epimerase family protein n=1 Tax=Acrasis kona TaxID=1008807 RepID=A0AAW2ZT77_9EUKA
MSIANKTVLVGGGTGFIGKELVSVLLKNNNKVIVVSRSSNKVADLFKSKDVKTATWEDLEHFKLNPDDIDVGINVTGEPIANRSWSSESNVRELLESRTIPTKKMISFLKSSDKEKTFVGTSAVGIYPLGQNKVYNESDQDVANTKIGTFCKDIEDTIADGIASSNIRPAIIRPGIVLGKEGGVLPIFQVPFMGYVMQGQNPLPWIHIKDLVDLYTFSAENSQINGPVNGVAPENITSEEFFKILHQEIKNRSTLDKFLQVTRQLDYFGYKPAQKLIVDSLRQVLGEERSSLLFEGQFAENKKAVENGFKFKYTNAREAIKDLL